MINNFELEKLAKFYKLPLISICMKNELPSTVIDGCYIINLESSTQGNGSHWVALFIYKDNSYYFDSFGAVSPNEIMEFVKKRKGCHMYFNNWIIQDSKSESCGWYSLGFLLYMWENRTRQNFKEVYNEYVNNFVDDTKHNDSILKSFFASSSDNRRPHVLKKFIS